MSKPRLGYVKKIMTSFVFGLGISSLIAIPAFSQSNPANRANRINTSRSVIIPQNRMFIRSIKNYPRGSRINANGIISTLRGERTIPSVSIKRGDGSTTYHYRDGSRINVERNTIPSTGTRIR